AHLRDRAGPVGHLAGRADRGGGGRRDRAGDRRPLAAGRPLGMAGPGSVGAARAGRGPVRRRRRPLAGGADRGLHPRRVHQLPRRGLAAERDLRMTPFWTRLGPDFAGKSTLLGRLRDEHGWQVVSHDDRFVGGYPLVATLRSCWVDEALVWAGKRYSAELVLAVMHAVILHQRDQLARQAGPEPVIIDSFYYKVLAACSLLGVSHGPTFDYWRSFPQPEGVVYLDVPPEVAWERTGQGAKASAFEH